jgi:chloramphenicol 3-O-phosphotransferase
MIAITDVTKPGQIVILNGAPRSGKSDTSRQSPEECAVPIRRGLDDGPPPTAFRRLADS